jgi:hypothetical protein
MRRNRQLSKMTESPLKQSRSHLVRVFDQNVFALRHLHAHVSDSANDAPSIGQRHVELTGEISGSH